MAAVVVAVVVVPQVRIVIYVSPSIPVRCMGDESPHDSTPLPTLPPYHFF